MQYQTYIDKVKTVFSEIKRSSVSFKINSHSLDIYYFFDHSILDGEYLPHKI